MLVVLRNIKCVKIESLCIKWFKIDWLRKQDLNLRPTGYENPTTNQYKPHYYALLLSTKLDCAVSVQFSLLEKSSKKPALFTLSCLIYLV